MTNGQAGNLHGMDSLDKGTIHTPGRGREDGERVHEATQNGTQFKMYELFISGIFHVIFWDLSGLRVTETATAEAKPQIRGVSCIIQNTILNPHESII